MTLPYASPLGRRLCCSASCVVSWFVVRFCTFSLAALLLLLALSFGCLRILGHLCSCRCVARLVVNFSVLDCPDTSRSPPCSCPHVRTSLRPPASPPSAPAALGLVFCFVGVGTTHQPPQQNEQRTNLFVFVSCLPSSLLLCSRTRCLYLASCRLSAREKNVLFSSSCFSLRSPPICCSRFLLLSRRGGRKKNSCLVCVAGVLFPPPMLREKKGGFFKKGGKNLGEKVF